MKASRCLTILRSTLTLVSILVMFQFANAQKWDRIEKGRMKSILKIVKSEVKKNYYDPNFRGIDLDKRFAEAEEKLDKATSTSQSIAIIVQVLIDFDDSHLYLAPPGTTLSVEYGWRMAAYGDKCYITEVRPKSDAEKKGLKRGDEVLSVSGFKPSRKELWKVLYYYNAISKRDRLTLTVRSPGDEAPRDLEIMANLKKEPRSLNSYTYYLLFDDFYNEENDKHRFITAGDITVWKMPSFAFDSDAVDGLLSRAKSDGPLILDLRGNGGGYVKTLEELTSNFFAKEIKIADLVGRKKMDPIVAKARPKAKFTGKLIVLIDSSSGSASEIFARVIQMEKRGTVLGDVSAGAVMQSRMHEGDVGGGDAVVPFGVSVTMADVIMMDGKSLEHVGVIPDELIIPTGADLAARRDPVMARAIELAGVKISAEEAGKFFQYYWKSL